jgi:hypothetical protein
MFVNFFIGCLKFNVFIFAMPNCASNCLSLLGDVLYICKKNYLLYIYPLIPQLIYIGVMLKYLYSDPYLVIRVNVCHLPLPILGL